MNNIMNTKVIETGLDLTNAIGQVVSDWEHPVLRLMRTPESDWDYVAEVDVDGKVYRFGVDCKLRPSIRDVKQLASRRKADPVPLLATVQATTSLVEHCKRFGVSCLDLNGRLWLRAKGLIVDRKAPDGIRFRTSKPPANVFSLKGSRIARALLSFPGRPWRQEELADFTGLSQGLISKLLRQASAEDWVSGSRGNWRVKDADAFLNAWKASDIWSKRVSVRQYSALESDLTKLAKRLLEHAPCTVAFTQWFAAGLRFPYTDVPILSAYLADFPKPSWVEALGCREVFSGGKIWLITPKDVGVFQAGRQVNGLPLVCDVQIYLDLLQVGLRGPDQAEALRAWEGFTRL